MENSKVTVKGGKYICPKWFIMMKYKYIVTCVEFSDNAVLISQGSAIFKEKNMVNSEIQYKDIATISHSKKINTAHAIAAAISALISIFSFANIYLLLFAAVLIFIGKTSVVKITHSNGVYTIPAESMKEAEELDAKINLAINQWRN